MNELSCRPRELACKSSLRNLKGDSAGSAHRLMVGLVQNTPMPSLQLTGQYPRVRGLTELLSYVFDTIIKASTH